MYAKKHRPMQKLTAICLSVSIAAASLLSGHVFAFDESAQPDGELLYGQRLLDELREMGLGQPDEDIVTDPVPETPAPGTDAETGGESASDPNAGTGESDPGVSDPDAGTGDNTGSSDAETGGDTEQPGEGGGSTETPVQPSDPAQPGGDGDGGTTEPSDPALPDEGGDNTGSEDPAESTDPTEDPSGETDSEPSDETDSDGAVTEPPVDSEQPAESETPAASTDDAQEENQPVVIGRVPLLIDNDEATVEEPTTVEDEDKTPAEPSGSDDGETPPTGNTSDEETTSGEDGSTNPPESQNPSEPSSEPSTPATPGEGENEGSNSSEPQEPSVPSTPSTPGEGETTPPTGGDGGNTGEQPIGPSHPIETPSESTGSEDIPEEEVPGAGYDRVALEAYVQELDAEQIVSLYDDSDMTSVEYTDLLSMMTAEQMEAVELLLNPTYGGGLTAAPVLYSPSNSAQTYSSFFKLSQNAIDDSVDANGLTTTKSATWEDGRAKITIEAYTEGAVTSEQRDIPLDIVVVIDQSASMDDEMTTYEYTKVYSGQLNTRRGYYIELNGVMTYIGYCDRCNAWTDGCDWDWTWDGPVHVPGTRYNPTDGPNDEDPEHTQFYTRGRETSIKRVDALKNALTPFVQDVKEKAFGEDQRPNTDDDIKHRMAFVGFGSTWNSNKPYRNSELFDGGTTINYQNLKQSDYQKAFKNMWTTDGANAINASIDAIVIQDDTATYSNLGMEMAQKVLMYNSDPVAEGEQRAKVVIFFTDGKPGTGDGSTDVANATIQYADTLKNQYGATIYSVGIFEGADNTDPERDVSYSGGWYGYDWGDDKTPNKFMHLVSSNYKSATSMDNPGSITDLPEGTSYYLAAADADGLSNIFQSIWSDVNHPAISLDESTVLKDYISDYFVLDGEAEDVKVYTANYNPHAENGWDPRVESDLSARIDKDGAICVTGFDFNAHFVDFDEDTNADAQKLIVEFYVTPKEGFLGGNGVPTNGDDSGVYDGSDKVVEHFDPPTVDVPINEVTVTAANKNVYLLGSLTPDQMKEGATVTVYDVTSEKNPYTLDLAKENFGLEPWQNRFVDISVTVNQPSLTDLEADTTFTVTAAIWPKDAHEDQKTASDTAKVNVFTPEITWKDSVLEAGQTPNYERENLYSVQWKHGTTLSTDPRITMIGNQPQLTYEYNPVTGTSISQETWVTVTSVKINGTDVKDYTTFVHQACGDSYPDCGWSDNTECHFIIHMSTFDLKVVKTVNGTYNDEDTFRFTVTGPDGFETSFTLGSEDAEGDKIWSITLKNLPAGQYTIEEDISWSWRYTCTTPTQTVGTDGNIQIVNGTATVTFENSNRENQWLSWEDTKVNIFQPTGTNG